MHTLMSLVSAGVGIAIAPASVGRYGLPHVVARDLRDMPPSTVVMAFREDEAAPAARAFIDLTLIARAIDGV